MRVHYTILLCQYMFEVFHNKKLIQKRERIKGENLDPTATNNSLRNCTALRKGEME